MLERLVEWPACGVDQLVPDFDNSIFYPAEDLLWDDLTYAADTDQQAPSDYSEYASRSRQNSMSETQDAISQWGYTPYTWSAGQFVRRPVIHRPVPRYPPGYDRGDDHLPPIDCHTSDGSTTDATPALTDSCSEPFHSRATGDVPACVSGPLQHKSISNHTQPLPEPQVSYLSTHFSSGIHDEDGFASKSVQGDQAQTSGHDQHPGIRVTQNPTALTHVIPPKFSRESHNALLRTRSPMPSEIKNPNERNPYSFVALSRRGYHPVISTTEIGGVLSDITADLNGKITILTKVNFCRVPGCGYWSKNAGRVPRHRLTHFKDRGFECQNPFRKGTDAPKHLQCQFGPGQYSTRLDLFKKHFRAPSCKEYAPSFTQDLQRSLWRGPDTVDEAYLLPFTRDVHVPFTLRAPKS